MNKLALEIRIRQLELALPEEIIERARRDAGQIKNQHKGTFYKRHYHTRLRMELSLYQVNFYKSCEEVLK